MAWMEGRLDLEGMLGVVEVVLAGVEGFLALGDDGVEGSVPSGDSWVGPSMVPGDDGVEGSVPSGGAGVEGVVVLGDDGAGADAAGTMYSDMEDIGKGYSTIADLVLSLMESTTARLCCCSVYIFEGRFCFAFVGTASVVTPESSKAPASIQARSAVWMSAGQAGYVALTPFPPFAR